MGHSYIGILINEQNAQKEPLERVFDALAYPYYFNQNSEVHRLVTDPSTLENVLEYYEKTDSRLLDHILLLDMKRLTPLHLARQNQIIKSLFILL